MKITSDPTLVFDLLSVRKKIQNAPTIEKNFSVNDVDFVIEKSYLGNEYLKHEIKNIKTGVTKIVTHQKLKEYLHKSHF